ncbi:inter-alpha-trypsin inhibitor heavy chain H6 isoform X2 [Megalops cyprinoides]|uniref:inter-alpha-trypsin inhibitor heavy chain H6 isoform X2 n=1 Tax=Megalops cyprinoides TaxID=118141 RepID=UPI0018656855|nr:inter-alpha-trypsin inhibitor heavy chain H6 isoform X2 [Megalops cyprinoides]
MGKVMRSVRRLCVILLFLTTSVEVGLSEEYRACMGARNNVFLQRVKRQTKPARPELKVTDFHVHCSVVSHYAATTVLSSVWNQLSVTKEAAFEVDLPSTAFISNFSITSNGNVYVAQVKERGVAKKIYDAAKKRGKTAGLVATKEREVEKFRVAVSVPSGTRLSFSLTYEELLARRLGHYELVLGLRPGQPVHNLSLEVTVAERSGISFIRALPLRTNRLLSNTVREREAEPPPSTQIQRTPHCARVRYAPTVQQQTSASPKGLSADFVIQYDVELSDLMGDIQIYDGYFVHFFAPRGLPIVPKDVIFVIDISGSMIGTKIKQTKQAMVTILSDLREGDHFNIITFSDKVHTWNTGGTVQATRQNVREAKEFVKKISAEGWTNINSALLSAAQLVNRPATRAAAQGSGGRRVPLVIFLTDGEPTIGVTSGEAILRNARDALGTASLFGLAFGDDADFPLLRRLALENRGVARMVYEDSDAALQLKGFYDEVASPLLSDIQLSYLDDQAYDVTRALFPNYFQGSELVVAGRIKPGVQDLKVSLAAVDSTHKLKLENHVSITRPESNGTLTCPGSVEGISSFVRRLWAYFTIKELLQTKLNTTDAATQRLLGEKATNLSLKYNFVTPFTSLVVVKPDADEMKPDSTPGPSATTTTSAPTTHTTTASVGVTTTNQLLTPVPVTKLATPGSTKKPSSTPSPRTSKPKLESSLVTKSPPHSPPSGLHTTGHPLQPPHSGRPSTTPTPEKTSSPSLTTKTTTPSPSNVKSVPSDISGKTSTTPKTTSPPLTLPTSSVKSAPSPLSGKTSTPPPTSAKTTPPSHFGKTSLSSSFETENGSTSATDFHHPHLTTLFHGLSVPPPATPNPATDTGSDTEVATLVAATFVPLAGAMGSIKVLEAASQLAPDVAAIIQGQKTDMELVKGDETDSDGRYYITNRGMSGSQTSQRLFSSSVDGDPHFVVHLSALDENLCFTIDGQANDVLRLLEDPEKGIIVDGRLAWAPSKLGFEDRSRTYFDQLTISAALGATGSFVIMVTLDAVVMEGEGRVKLSTNKPGSVTRQGIRVAIDDHLRCWVELGWGLRFLILFHHYKHPTYLQIAHLGFYVAEGEALSPLTQGLLGQFQHSGIEIDWAKEPQDSTVQHTQENAEGHLAVGVLRRGEVSIHVTLQDKHLKDTVRKRHHGRCWVVARGDVETLLGHPYQSYVVDHI